MEINWIGVFVGVLALAGVFWLYLGVKADHHFEVCKLKREWLEQTEKQNRQLSEALNKLREYRERVHIPDIDPQPIPRHGAGLSEAEDAMRDDVEDWVARCNRDGKQLRLIMENAPRGGIYYRLQDRFTCRNIQSGIAKDKAEMLGFIEEADKARIYELRRYGMEV